MKRLITLIFGLLFPVLSILAQDRYIIFLSNKDNSPYSINEPESFLSPRSIARKIKEGVLIDLRDIPVNKTYIDQIGATGASCFYTSKWFNTLLIQATQQQLDEIIQLPFVIKYELVAPGAPLVSGGRITNKLEMHSSHLPIDSYSEQSSLIGMDYMHSLNIKGQGISIASMDAGFPGVNTLTAFDNLQQGSVIYTFDYVSNNSDVYHLHPHGTNTLSLLASTHQDLVGLLPEANYSLFITENVQEEYRMEEWNWIFAAEKADSLGVDIITTSLGYSEFYDARMDYTQNQLDGNTATITLGANIAVEKGMIVVLSSGNDMKLTWGTFSFPSDCIGCVTAGSVNSNLEIAEFSAYGRTIDGRRVPTFVTSSAPSFMVTASGNVSSANGTSLSAPQVAGLLGGLKQYYPNLKNDELIVLLTKSSPLYHNPDPAKGFGIPSFKGAVNLMEAASDELKISIYPNPLVRSNNALLTISSSQPAHSQEVSMMVYNSLGQLVYSEGRKIGWNELDTQIDFSNFPPGFYNLRILINEEVKHSEKIIVR